VGKVCFEKAISFEKRNKNYINKAIYMNELFNNFFISQILMLFAIGFDFLSMQLKERKQMYLALVFSASLISIHLFLLGKTTTWLIVLLSVFRFIVCMFSTNKRYLLIFILLNTIALIYTFTEIYDLILYTWLTIFIIGNFQKNEKIMRKIMMTGTTTTIMYYIVIFSPMAIIAESIFLLSAIIGYYRYYIKKEVEKLQN